MAGKYTYKAIHSQHFLMRQTLNCNQYEPEPATPTVAAPAPMNLAAESMSRVTGEVWNDLICGSNATGVVF